MHLLNKHIDKQILPHKNHCLELLYCNNVFKEQYNNTLIPFLKTCLTDFVSEFTLTVII